MTDAGALAGDYRDSVCNLEAIARFYVREFVRVHWQPSQHWLGLARRTEHGAEILLNPYAAAADLPFIFFHEVGHHVRGHVVTINPLSLAEMADDDQAARLERMTPPEADTWRAVIATREDEANEWARAHLAAYEARFGPFLRAI